MVDEYKNAFLWGVATSAFQIEGHIENDMTQWEKSIIDVKNGGIPGFENTSNHWRLWSQDYEILKELGVNSYRFSLEWSRLEPEPGKFNLKAADQYDRMIDKLLENDIIPMVTIHHFTHPKDFHSNTPWHLSSSVDRFLNYIEFLNDRFLDRIPYVLTFNEPLVWALAAYGSDHFPPGYNNLNLMMKALHYMLFTHRQAYELIKKRNPETKIGIANNFIIFRQANFISPIDGEVRRLIDYFYNEMILEAFRTNRLKINFPGLLFYDSPIPLDNKIDFWGVNYYYRLHVGFRLDFSMPFRIFFKSSAASSMSDLGWEIYPEGLYEICDRLKETDKDFIITENGIAAKDDKLRIKFLKSHLRIIRKMIKGGYRVRGYYHWTLLDNYEWTVGFSAKFGLVKVDFQNGYKRSIKKSGTYYSRYLNLVKNSADF